MDQIKIGRFIAERRRALQLTQRALGETLGIGLPQLFHEGMLEQTNSSAMMIVGQAEGAAARQGIFLPVPSLYFRSEATENCRFWPPTAAVRPV